MPELPEVETVRRTLEPLINGKTIKNVTVWYPKIIVGDANEFADKLKNNKIITVDRYGKYLLIRLSDNLTLVSHLRMEGKYRLVDSKAPKQKHEHVQFEFSDGSALRYDDVRKFGRMHLVETGTEKVVTGIRHLGPEPNSSEFTINYFVNALTKKKKNIKNTLLDQTIVCGLGNIYVDEVLWQSEIHPLSSAQKIPRKQVQILHDNINQIIKRAIDLKGTSVHTFLDAAGDSGKYQNELNVYGRVGEPCIRCNTRLEKIKVGGRGTTFCSHCQMVYK